MNTKTYEEIKAMTRKDRLILDNELLNKETELYSQVKAMKDNAKSLITSKINELSTKPVEIVMSIDRKFSWKNGNNDFEVYASISQYDDYDSNIPSYTGRLYLTIHSNELKVSSSSSYSDITSNDTLDIASMKLAIALLENDKEFIEIASKNIDLDMILEYDELIYTHDKIARINSKEDDEAKKLAVIESIKPENMYYDANYSEDEDCGWLLRVTKITNKTVFCDQLHKFREYNWNERKYEEPKLHFHCKKRYDKDVFVNMLSSKKYIKTTKEN